MIDSPDMLLDLTEYRQIAGYILALLLLRQSGRNGLLGIKLRTPQEADWFAARLRNQGYVVEVIEQRAEQTVMTIRNTV